MASKPIGRAAPTARNIGAASGIGTGARRPVASSGLAGRGANGTSDNGHHANGRVEELESRINEMKLTVDSLERERDFYYGKLREIEVMCQGQEENNETTTEPKQIISKILDILYATEDGFAVPDEVGDDVGYANSQDEY